jgi:hypothetical protein
VSTQIAWDDIESIMHGRLGRTMAICPLCSESRRTPQKRFMCQEKQSPLKNFDQ